MAYETDRETALSDIRSSISEREAEVLGLIAEGRSSKEVAGHLCISKRTIDFHLSNVYDKLGVGNRVNAIRVAERLGVLYDGRAVRRLRDLTAELEMELVGSKIDPAEPVRDRALDNAR